MVHALLFALALQGGTDSVVARATAVTKAFADTTDIKKAGYQVLGFGRTKDLGPFQGQHWLDRLRIALAPTVDLSKPSFVMYLPIRDTLRPIGVAYGSLTSPGTKLPTTLAGTPAEWHAHQFCEGVPGEGRVLADGTDDCKDRGGTPVLGPITMVHTWTIPNPDGPYAHDNPSLPFIAVGLAAPERPSPEDRTFGLALAETYGARLPAAHRITREAGRNVARAETLEKHREVIRTLLPKLRDAETTKNRATYNLLRGIALSEWRLLLEDYKKMAPSDAIKNRLHLEVEEATGMGGHHHG